MRDKKRFKIYSIIVLLTFLGGVIYLNRSYAYIYNTIGSANLKEVNPKQKYMIANNLEAINNLNYVAIGDSLTAGVGTDYYEESWPYLLAQKLSSQDKVINLSVEAVPGYKTADVISKLLEPAIKNNPDVVTILIGVNDIHSQVLVKDFKNNYEIILSRLAKETKAKIYLINLPYIGADTLIEPPYNMCFDRRTQEFNEVIKKLAVKYRVSYVDLYTDSVSLFKKSGDHYSSDLFHPSVTGYKIWADIIYDSINK